MSLEQALALPEREFFDPLPSVFDPHKAMLVRMYSRAVTCSRSLYPVIGTEAVANCLSVAGFNGQEQTAAVNHEPTMETGDIDELLDTLRTGRRSRAELHFFGACYYPGDEDGNNWRKENLREIFDHVSRKSSVVIKSFDVLWKTFPETFAIDFRNGNLYAGAPKINYYTGERGEYNPTHDRMQEAKFAQGGYDGLAELARDLRGR